MVRPPGSQGWERTAVAFLLDCCPPDYRGYPVMIRHPVVLARCAKAYVASMVEATESSIATLRPQIAEYVSADTADAAISALQREQARLLRVARAVDLVDQALRDVRFVQKL